MRGRSALAFMALLAAACAGGSTQTANAPAPESSAFTGKPCAVSVKDTDVSSWQEVAGEGFTFCAPRDWIQQGYTLRHGNAFVAFRAVGRQVVGSMTTATTTGTAAGGTAASSRNRSPTAPDMESRQFSEVVNGLRVNFSRTRKDSDIFTSASWDSPYLLLSGRAGDQLAAETEFAIYHTVRFAAH
jgi:hypothetical protein